MNRFVRIALIVVGVLIVLVVGGVALAAHFIKLDVIINEQIAKEKPDLEKQLGRKIAIGPVTTTIFPILGAKVGDISIAADPGHPEDDQPLLRIKEFGFSIGIWDAIVTQGKVIRVKEVHLDGLQVSLIRYADGTLSYQDIVDRQPKTDETKPAEPMNPNVLQLLNDSSIEHIAMDEATLRLVDYATPSKQKAESVVKHTSLHMDNVRLRDPIAIELKAAAFEENQNILFQTSVGPLPADLKIVGTPPINKVHLELKGVDLARITPYLGKKAPLDLDSAEATATVDVGSLTKPEPVPMSVLVDVKHMQLPGGKPFELHVDTKLTADLVKLGLALEKFDLKMNQVELAGSGALLDLATAPHFKDFIVKSTTLDFNEIVACVPSLKKSLPPGLKLSGLGKLDVKGQGDAQKQTLVATLDLSAMDIFYPGTLTKPHGVPLVLTLDGDFTSADATLRKLELALDELDINANGTVKNFAKPTFDLVAAAKPFRFDRLARLLPSMSEALQKSNATAAGEGHFDAKVKGTPTNLDASLNLDLSGVKLKVPGTALDGSVSLRGSVKGDPAKALHAELLLDAGNALIVVDKTLNKQPATVLRLQTTIDRAGDLITVKTFDLKLAELRAQAGGTFDTGKGTTSLAVDIDPLDLEKFAKTVTAIPADKVKHGKIDVKVNVDGNPNHLESMKVALTNLVFKTTLSDMAGSVVITNLTKPNVDAKLSSQNLDIDELAPPDPAAKTGPKPEAKDDPTLKNYTVKAVLDVAKMYARGYDLTHFRGTVRLVDGVLYIDDGSFGIFGGTVSASGTQAAIWKGVMPFTAKLVVKNVEMNDVLSAKSTYKDMLFGKGDLNVNVSGVGTETDDLARALTGDVGLGLVSGRINGSSLTSKLIDPLQALLAKIPGAAAKQPKALAAAKQTNSLQDLAAQTEIKSGQVLLKQPIDFKIDGAKLRLEGGVGILGALALRGTYAMPGALVATATGGKCSVAGEFPVPLSITGTATKPSVSPDLSAIGSQLLSACLKGSALGGLADTLKSKTGIDVPLDKAAAEKAAKALADKARADADAAARAQADKAKAEAKAQADKLRADAEAAKKKAEADAKARLEAEKKKAADAAKAKLHGFGLP